MTWLQRPRRWAPPAPPNCTCVRHLDDELLATVVPFADETSAQPDEEPVTIADLIEWEALAAKPDTDSTTGRDGVPEYTWTIWFGDETRAHYDDDAALPLDEAVRQHAGAQHAAWADREVVELDAPTMCRDGILAAAAATLLDDRVRR